MTPPFDPTGARSAARELFGHSSLLPGQREAIEALLSGRDVLLISPTGSGKSLSYQVAGVLIESCTVVVSPLLALQKDQIDHLGEEDRLELRAARISSEETDAQREDALARAAAGDLEFLFLSPEQLANPDVRRVVADLRPGLVAVDEAHCVSAWGHDFRPDYFRLGELIADLGDPRVIAMTATAAPPVRSDIVDRLRLRDHRLVVTGFERPELALHVVRVTDAAQQRRGVLELVAESEGSGIVYCRTRRSAEEYAAAIAELGRSTVVYHAGMGKKARAAAHEAFLSGAVEVVVATSAFGMGIDKPNIRFVVHAQVPESPDTYYQEVGRAGRDRQPATATLLYRPEDLSLGRFFSGGVPRRTDVEAVLAVRAEVGGGLDEQLRAVRDRTGLGPRKAGRVLNLAALVERLDRQVTVDAVLEQAEAHRALQRSRVDMMRGYAETDRCRAEFLLAYFGEAMEERCGVCDNCLAGVSPEPVVSDEAYPLQSQVSHEEFGPGTVTDVEDDRLTVLFEEVGYRTLSRRVVEEQRLLERRG